MITMMREADTLLLHFSFPLNLYKKVVAANICFNIRHGYLRKEFFADLPDHPEVALPFNICSQKTILFSLSMGAGNKLTDPCRVRQLLNILNRYNCLFFNVSYTNGFLSYY